MRFLALVLMTLSSPAFAEVVNVPLDLRCVTSLPTTSFIAKTTENEVRLTVLHHNGVKYMPIHQGIVVPADIPLLQKNAEVMQKLGDRLEIVFEKSHCKKYGERLYSCGLGKVVDHPEMERPSILTKTARERLFDVEFEKSTVSFSFGIGGVNYSIENDFYDDTCKFGEYK